MKLLELNAGPALQALVERVCADHDHIATPVSDPSRALEVLASTSFDVVIVTAEFAEMPSIARGLGDLRRRADAPSVLAVARDLDAAHALIDEHSAVIDEFAIEPIDARELALRLTVIEQRRMAVPPSQAILAALPDLMFRLARDGTYLDYHAPDPSMLVSPPEQLIGARMSDELPPEVAAQSLSVIAQVLDSGTPGMFEYALPLPGGVQHFEARLVPSGPDEVLTIVRNVTDRKLAEAELRAAALAQQKFTSRVVQAQEAERQHISRELHDVIGQMLLVHRMDAEWIVTRARACSDELADAGESLCSSLDDTLQMVRELARDLRPAAIDDLGIASALETLAYGLDKRSEIHVSCDLEDDMPPVPADVGVALYRIAQEALANAVRHARCENILVELRADGPDVELRVSDDGVGLDPGRVGSTFSLGLLGMRERAELFGGRVSIESSPGRGTSVVARIPRDEVVKSRDGQPISNTRYEEG